jgi:hypothetical protein
MRSASSPQDEMAAGGRGPLAETLLVDADPRAGWADALLTSSPSVGANRAAGGDARHVSPSADEVETRRDAEPFPP